MKYENISFQGGLYSSKNRQLIFGLELGGVHMSHQTKNGVEG